MNELAKEMERTVCFDIDPETPVNVIAEAYMKVQHIKAVAKLADERLKESMIEWIKANPSKDLEWGIGDGDKQRFYLGHKKVTKPKDARGALFTLIGDLSVEDAANCISANGIKHGTFKKLLPERFDEFFEVVVQDTLESGEPAPKELQSVNTKFI